MKIFTLLVVILVSIPTVFAQLVQNVVQIKVDCAAVTQRILQQHYSVDEQLALQASPEKMECLNYMLAQSYEFEAGQAVLKSQKVLFDVTKYNHLRSRDQRVIVHDEMIGCNIVLFSWVEVESSIEKIRLKHELAALK